MLRPFGSNFHAHSDYSIDGGSSVEKIVKRAKELNTQHIVLTEHGNMNSAAELAMYAEKHGISYSHGIEVYLKPPLEELGILESDLSDKDARSYYHMIILFKTVQAYEYFCKLSPEMESRAVIRYGERKPILELSELFDIRDHIVIGSGCLVGLVGKSILSGKRDLAEKAYLLTRSLVPEGNFFVEIFPSECTHEWVKPQYSNTGEMIKSGFFALNETIPGYNHNDKQKVQNDFLMEMAQKYNDMLIISEDSHFAYDHQKVVQDSRLGNGKENWRFHTSYHMRSTQECMNFFLSKGYTEKTIEEMIDNSYILKSRLSEYRFLTKNDRWILPVFNGDTKTHLLNLIKKHGRMKNEKVYIDRLKHEISVLSNNSKADFLPYFFEVEDVSSWCKENGILMNLRGSGGGSLITYLIGASITDPIKYNLPFERFLTYGRIDSGALPDLDADFSDKTIVIESRKQKYGDRVVPISINIGMKLKNSIRDVERAILGKVRKETEGMCVKFPGIPQGITEVQWLYGYEDKDTGEHISGFWDINSEIRVYAEENPKLWSIIEECLGTVRNKGSHACGYLITPKPVQNYFPITWVGTKKNGQFCTAFDPKTLEWSGGIKYDFLGVKTLKVIQLATVLIKERHGVSLEWNEYPHDDLVYEKVFHSGKTMGIFQFNTEAVTPYVRRIKPKSTKDLSAITALVRPGALDAPAPDGSDLTAAQYYLKVAQGERKSFFIHSDLIPILSETNGVILYQEQLLEIFVKLGKYSLEKAEGVRRGISKKDKDAIQTHCGNLRRELILKGWVDSQVNTLMNQILASSRYSFNKSHSMSYSIVGYNTAYLKYHYPLEFWTSELTVFSYKEDKLRNYLSYLGGAVLPPSISCSHPSEFKIEGNKIRSPLILIKGLGAAAVAAIAEAAPYSSIEDFATRCNARVINRGVFPKIAISGLFDDFNLSFDEIMSRYWTARKLGNTIPEEYKSLSDIEIFSLKKSFNPVTKEKLYEILESTLLSKGFVKVKDNKKIPFLFSTDSASKRVSFLSDTSAATEVLQNSDVKNNTLYYMVALFDGSSVFTSKSDQQFLKINLSDGQSNFEAIDWNCNKALNLRKKTPVLVKGVLRKGYKIPLCMYISSIEPLK